MLDSLGCAIYGANLRMVPYPAGHTGNSRRDAHHLDLGHECTPSSAHAALVTARRCRASNSTTCTAQAVLHVGAVTLPALIAVAESHAKLSGRDFLTAAVAGYEIGPRVGLCMGQEHIGQGWHSGATVGVFSAAAGPRARLASRGRRPSMRSASPARNRPA